MLNQVYLQLRCAGLHAPQPTRVLPCCPLQNTIWETEVLVNTPLGRLQIITPMLGRHAAYNILAGE